MWALVIGTVIGSGSMMFGVFLGFALSERAQDRNEKSNISGWN